MAEHALSTGLSRRTMLTGAVAALTPAVAVVPPDIASAYPDATLLRRLGRTARLRAACTPPARRRAACSWRPTCTPNSPARAA